NPIFELAGLFTWNQTQPSKNILKQWEVFGIKVEMDSQRPVVGSDVTLSCTISRLSDTNKEKEIASTYKSQPINVNRTDFGDRLVPTETNFNGKDFRVRIVPVLFEDAGVYTCSLGTYKMVTITLITVKVTAEPSDAASEGDTVTLTCSVSDVTESMRLVWMSSDEKTVVEKTLNGQNGEEKSLRLIIQKAERGSRNWTCVLFHQRTPKIFIPHYLKVNSVLTFQHTNIFIFASVPLLLIVILALVLSLRKCKAAAVENQRQEPLQPGENAEDASHLYSNVHEMQQMQGDNEMPEKSRFDEYAIINKTAKRDDTEREDIQYATLNFQKKAPGSKQGTKSTQCNQQSSDTELAPSNDNGSSVIYAQVAQTQFCVKHQEVEEFKERALEIKLRNLKVFATNDGIEGGNSERQTGNVKGDHPAGSCRDLHNIKYTLYRSRTNHSELDLICDVISEYIKTKWTWSSRYFQNQEKEIASTYKSQLINVNRTDFGDRLFPTETNFNSKNFRVRIVPVLFEDAGVYTCSLGTSKMVTITLITVKVTAEPSDAVSEGDTVTLTCSVSDVTGSMRLVWISSDGKTVVEKTLKEGEQGEDLFQLIIQKAERGSRNWTCVLFHQNTPKIFIPHYLKVNSKFQR
ncbi:hypothetical protein scyTo_0014457, partial [Scyliorhinus torazame]|nr:hypothetical protein [Scyliorhinus torazame]